MSKVDVAQEFYQLLVDADYNTRKLLTARIVDNLPKQCLTDILREARKKKLYRAGNRSRLMQLSTVILSSVCSFLGSKSMANLEQTCRPLRNLCLHEGIWQHLDRGFPGRLERLSFLQLAIRYHRCQHTFTSGELRITSAQSEATQCCGFIWQCSCVAAERKVFRNRKHSPSLTGTTTDKSRVTVCSASLNSS